MFGPIAILVVVIVAFIVIIYFAQFSKWADRYTTSRFCSICKVDMTHELARNLGFDDLPHVRNAVLIGGCCSVRESFSMLDGCEEDASLEVDNSEGVAIEAETGNQWQLASGSLNVVWVNGVLPVVVTPGTDISVIFLNYKRKYRFDIDDSPVIVNW